MGIEIIVSFCQVSSLRYLISKVWYGQVRLEFVENKVINGIIQATKQGNGRCTAVIFFDDTETLI